jgi:hypothetical protein
MSHRYGCNVPTSAIYGVVMSIIGDASNDVYFAMFTKFAYYWIKPYPFGRC